MIHFTLKTKLTLLYTTLMTIVVCLCTGILFMIGEDEILTSVTNDLDDRVNEATSYIQLNNQQLIFDKELLEIEDGVYLSIYDEHQELVYGRIPYGFAYDTPLQEGRQKISTSDNEYYIFDIVHQIQDTKLYIRGIVSLTKAEQNYRFMMHIAFILFPIFVFFSAICGYLLCKRSLSSVSKITNTVQNIQKEHNLSQRIALKKGHDEIHILAQTFDSLLDTIETNMQREKQFTSDVAHELRTPLSVLLMQCDTLLSSIHDPSMKHEIIIMKQRLQHMSDIMTQLLLLSKADQGQAILQKEYINMSELCEICCEQIKDLSQQKHITVHLDIMPDIMMMADHTLMIRLCMNVLENAVKYGKENGHIHITLTQDDKVNFIIKDDGIGIPNEDLPHIFDRFYRVDQARDLSMNSSGLGLSIVKWIVQAHEGTVQVESTLHHGTTFTFSFPIEQMA